MAFERAALEASLATHLESINALLDPHERLDCLVVVSQPWTVESGLITPTFKVRRIDPLTKCRGSVRELTSIVHPLKVNPTPKEDGG